MGLNSSDLGSTCQGTRSAHSMRVLWGMACLPAMLSHLVGRPRRGHFPPATPQSGRDWGPHVAGQGFQRWPNATLSTLRPFSAERGPPPSGHFPRPPPPDPHVGVEAPASWLRSEIQKYKNTKSEN